ncbi:hypothetical protein N7516_006580 [Penicillium verrucosum]|uniref:uncharacterized protein n=1 Tax=Penicillium verrucosum TaxID=60171 RepID=UPI002544FD0A|nr:uncharacterized protein N7516_006580 [Penicillium verrucosum]KAJ5932091.1 hypothetical protein N7516_006580 [Penicillium verrucosum]
MQTAPVALAAYKYTETESSQRRRTVRCRDQAQSNAWQPALPIRTTAHRLGKDRGGEHENYPEFCFVIFAMLLQGSVNWIREEPAYL